MGTPRDVLRSASRNWRSSSISGTRRPFSASFPPERKSSRHAAIAMGLDPELTAQRVEFFASQQAQDHVQLSPVDHLGFERASSVSSSFTITSAMLASSGPALGEERLVVLLVPGRPARHEPSGLQEGGGRGRGDLLGLLPGQRLDRPQQLDHGPGRGLAVAEGGHDGGQRPRGPVELVERPDPPLDTVIRSNLRPPSSVRLTTP